MNLSNGFFLLKHQFDHFIRDMQAVADQFVINLVVEQTGAQTAHPAMMDPRHDVRRVRRP